MLITVTGRTSGRTYTLPVNYLLRGSDLYVISQPRRSWWRNLRPAGPVTLFLKGRERKGHGEVLPAGDAAFQTAAAGSRMAKVLAAHTDWPLVHISLDG